MEGGGCYIPGPSRRVEKAGTSVRVLVVDDDESTAVMVSRFLAKEGFDVLTALDATKALDLLSREKVDAVVTDLMMPRIDGRELVRQLRSDPKTRDLPVIMVTAYGSDEAAEAGLRDGASLFLAKPLDLALLATVLRMSSRSD
jgi:CheY-like chemotaxis protein